MQGKWPKSFGKVVILDSETHENCVCGIKYLQSADAKRFVTQEKALIEPQTGYTFDLIDKSPTVPTSSTVAILPTVYGLTKSSACLTNP